MKRSNLKRKSSLRSTGPPRRRTRLKPVNAKRRKREWRRAFGSKERVAFVKSLPCEVCGATPSENAHAVTLGMGIKAPADKILPLCAQHHREQHLIGVVSFEARHGVDLLAAARRVEARWQEHRNRESQ